VNGQEVVRFTIESVHHPRSQRGRKGQREKAKINVEATRPKKQEKAKSRLSAPGGHNLFKRKQRPDENCGIVGKKKLGFAAVKEKPETPSEGEIEGQKFWGAR